MGEGYWISFEILKIFFNAFGWYYWACERAQKGSMQEVTSQIQFRSIVLDEDCNFVSAGEWGQLRFMLKFSRMRHNFLK